MKIPFPLITVVFLWLFTAERVAFALAISLVNTRPLQFTRASPNDGPGTEAGTSGNANSARYTVTGNPNQAYVVTILPGSATMTGPGTSIVANTFTKSSGSGTYTLDGTGTDYVYIGATRAAIPGVQTSGAYTVQFQIGVQYVSGGKTNLQNAASNINILSSIGISKVTDLNFGDAALNDLPKVMAAGVAPSGAGTVSRAQFSVTGAPSAGYLILLPADGTVIMTTGAGLTADTQIPVNTFTSSPVSPGALSVGGAQTVYVGATRAAIRGTQTPGSYSTLFTVTVTYQ